LLVAAQRPIRGAFFLPRESDSQSHVVELAPDAGVVAAHGFGLEPPGRVELLGRRIRLAERAAEPGELAVVVFRSEVVAVPVGVDLIPCAMAAEQGG
jgi:hypothetical protein